MTQRASIGAPVSLGQTTALDIPAPAKDGEAVPVLKGLAIRGVVATVIGYGASQLLRFGTNLILTRLLVPEYFGIMSLVNVVVIGLSLSSDIGLGTSVVRHRRGDDHVFLDTVWTLQVIRGVALWLAGLMIARPLARFYADDRLLWLIPIISLNAVISGFHSVSLLTLRRQMAIGHLTALELVAQAVSVSALIALARLHLSIEILALAYLIPTLIKLGWSQWLSRARPNRFRWDQAALSDLLTFGRWVWISTLLAFLASQADRLILGKVFSLELLGVYGIAFALSEMPRGVALAVAGNVIYPGISKLAYLPRATLRRVILQHRWPILVTMALGVTAMVGFGDLVIRVLYDRRYTAAGWMLPILALGIWPNSLTQTIDSALFAIGKPRYVVYGNVCRLCFTLVGIPIAYKLMGVVGAVIIVALNDLPFYGPVSYGLWREGLSAIRQDVKATTLFLGLLALVLLARQWLGLGLPFAPSQ